MKRLLLSLFFTCTSARLSLAATTGSGMPYDSSLDILTNSLQGKVTYVVIVFAIFGVAYAILRAHHHGGAVVEALIGTVIAGALLTHIPQIMTIFGWSGALC